MIKSEIKVAQKQPEKVAFPALYQAVENNGHIVLFTSYSTGVVVNSGRTDLEIGHCSNMWYSCLSPTSWTPLPSGYQVVLTQE